MCRARAGTVGAALQRPPRRARRRTAQTRRRRSASRGWSSSAAAPSRPRRSPPRRAHTRARPRSASRRPTPTPPVSASSHTDCSIISNSLKLKRPRDERSAARVGKRPAASTDGSSARPKGRTDEKSPTFLAGLCVARRWPHALSAPPAKTVRARGSRAPDGEAARAAKPRRLALRDDQTTPTATAPGAPPPPPPRRSNETSRVVLRCRQWPKSRRARAGYWCRAPRAARR